MTHVASELAAAIFGTNQTSNPPTGLILGVIQSIQGSGTSLTVTATLGGSTIPQAGLAVLSSYSPTVGDTCWFEVQPSDDSSHPGGLLIGLGTTGVGASSGVLTGEVRWGGWAAAPPGWFLCDGAQYNSTSYAALFAVIGYTFGGGSGNFAVPDLRGASPIGAGQGVYTGATNHLLGGRNGEEVHTLTVAEVPALHMTFPVANAAAGGPRFTTGSDVAGTGGLTTDTGSGGSHNTYHPVVALTAIIKT